MTVLAAAPPPEDLPPRRNPPLLLPAAPCPRCKQPTLSVRVAHAAGAGRSVLIDGRGEHDGNLWVYYDGELGAWLAKRWLPLEDQPETGPEVHRCREHRCHVATDPLVGPCAGGCGATVRRYDPGSTRRGVEATGERLGQPLCRWCREVLTEWRADRNRPAQIPFGRWHADAYEGPCAGGCGTSVRRYDMNREPPAQIRCAPCQAKGVVEPGAPPPASA